MLPILSMIESKITFTNILAQAKLLDTRVKAEPLCPQMDVF
ncbi:hypothetical protein AVDCRST_MAG81-4878 [uncultured Synechococcales cyanobacterium]|uniref:Uncharacterized protein n=1 Tax=uncultured Synechococcales cyanobacterium TaxID=1936017 RepID=A0A6N3IPD8_9CYAN|nr:hypothetical protein AVDCRST_MAG81-4878 [uncultured Synechococcales cyanobacterium]